MIQRREVFRRTLQVFGATLPLASNAQSALSRFKGSTLRIHYPVHPHFERVERQFASFTELTGIRIDGQRTPYLDMKARQLASLSRGSGDFDLLAYLILWKVEYALNGWLRPLEPLLADSRLALPGFALEGMIEPYVDAIGRVGGPKEYLPGPGARLIGLPCGAETSLLAMRTDLLAKHGLAIPTQYSELLHACRVLRDKERIAGLATRGKAGHHITHAWLLHLTPHGGTVFDADWNAAFHRGGGVRATEVLREIATLAPEGAAEAGFAEMQNDFLQGRAAFYLDSSNLLGVAKDPKQTQLAGRIGYAMHPSGSRLSGQTGGFGLGIAGNASQPEAAFIFLQWLTSPATDLATARDGGVAARWSTLADPVFRMNNPEQSIMRFALRAANPDWRPLIPEWDRISQDLLGKSLPGMVFGGRPIKEGLAGLAAAIDADLLRTGRRAATSPRPRMGDTSPKR